MRRLLALIAIAVVALAGLLVGLSNADGKRDGEPSGDYRVRAIFDNASAASEGEDVKVAGARVGEIQSLDVTPQRKAVLVLKVTDRRFAPFHADATCKLRPEGVLAVKFVECDPGTSSTPALRIIRKGDGKGQALLPVQRTSSSVDLDLVNNIYRQPTGQQLAILLSEFGTGLAGRGSDLNAVIHRANPALGQTARFLKVLASQSDRLERFAVQAETLLHPLARDRASIAEFIVAANKTNRATALRSDDVQRTIERFPTFLRSLRSQMTELHAFSNQGIPLLADLKQAAPAVGRATVNLGRLSKAATPATKDLGATAARITPKLLSTLPLLRKLQAYGSAAKPVASQLSALLNSFDRQLGIKHLLQLVYYAANAVNGFDSVGHYARAEALSGACAEYTGKGFFGCDSQWGVTATSSKPVIESPSGKLSPVPASLLATTSIPPKDSPDSQGAGFTADASTRRLLNYLLGP